jgi:hypothetical protein
MMTVGTAAVRRTFIKAVLLPMRMMDVRCSRVRCIPRDLDRAVDC